MLLKSIWDRRLFILVSISVFISQSLPVAVDGVKNKTRPVDVPRPQFFLESTINECRHDSPEIFYYGVALPSVTSLLQEGKIFFGVLMDRLESSLAGAEKYVELEKEWTFLMNVITESFELAVGRIHTAWYAIIDSNDSPKLPWETSFAKALLLDHFNALATEYQVLEAVVKAGTREIINTLQKYLVEVMQKVEDSIFAEPNPSGKQPTDEQLLLRMEKAVSKLEPNFVGSLLKKLLYMSRVGALETMVVQPVSFVANAVEEMVIVQETFRTKAEGYPNFWSDMTEIMKSVNGSVNPIPEDVLQLYLSNEELVIDTVIILLQMELH